MQALFRLVYSFKVNFDRNLLSKQSVTQGTLELLALVCLLVQNQALLGHVSFPTRVAAERDLVCVDCGYMLPQEMLILKLLGTIEALRLCSKRGHLILC